MTNSHVEVESKALALIFLIVSIGLLGSIVQAQCPVDRRLVKKSEGDGIYYLPRNYVFKVKFDSPVSTELYKTGSIVQFSVVENVFGIRLPEFENDEALNAFTTSLDALIDEFEREIADIQNEERDVANQIAKSERDNPKKRTEQVDSLRGNTDEELRKLYVDQANRLRELFKTQANRLEQDIDNKYQSAVVEIRQTFRKRTDRINAAIDAMIASISPNNPERTAKIGKLNFERNERLEQLNEGEAEEIAKRKTSKEEKVAKLKQMPEIVVVIPKESKGFGKVERAKRQLPLFLNYKARISVVLDYVLLTNGDCIPIEVQETPDPRLSDGLETELGNVIDCKSGGLKGKKCIKGRRPIYNFISPIISGLAAVATVLVKDSTAQALAGVTAVDQLTEGDLGKFVGGSDALISDKLIYEVVTKESRIGAIKKDEKK